MLIFYVAHGTLLSLITHFTGFLLFKWEFMIIYLWKIGLLDRGRRKSYLVIQDM